MRKHVVAAVTLAMLTAGTAAAQRQESVLGTRLALDRRGAAALNGELVAVRNDTLWLLPPDGTMRVVRLSEVTRARVPRPGISAGGVILWTLVGGALSGGLLAAACSGVEDADCGGVLPGVMVSWGLVGGLSAALAGSGWRSVAVDAAALAPYARFPQGLPAGFVPESPRDSQPNR